LGIEDEFSEEFAAGVLRVVVNSVVKLRTTLPM
jgi:hypothetical protein